MIVSLSRCLAVALLLLGILLRFVYLDADPYYYEWVGYVTDEGRWTAHARGLALFGQPFDAGWPLHLLLAPLYQAANYAIFSLSTVSLTTSRLLSAVAGSALLVTFWLLMRRLASPPALLVGLTLLALEMDVLVLSRLAVPEMAVMAVQLLVYALIVATPGSPGRLALGGFLQAVAVGMKATALPTLVIFLVMVLVRPPAPGAPSRWKSLAAFGAGFVGPVAVTALVWSLWGFPGGLDRETLETILARVRLSSAYYAIGFFFDNALAPIVNTWAVALWLGIVGWMSSEDVDPRLRRYLRTATVWWVAYSVMMLGLLYFPNRYRIHVFVPMAISIAAGLTLFQKAGLAGVDAALARGRGLAAALRLGLVALPPAVFLAPLLAAGAGLAAESPPHLRLKLVGVAISVVLIAWILDRRRRRGRSNGFFVAFPLVAVIAWWASRWTAFGDFPFWPTTSFSTHAGWWIAFLLATALITGLTTRSVRRAGSLGAPRLIAAGAVAALVLSIVNVAPGYLDPQYSIRAASRGLGELFSGYGGVVSTLNGDGLFNENRLRYAAIFGPPTGDEVRPEVLVTVLDPRDSDGALGQAYCLVERYPLYVSPQFFRSHPEVGLGPDTVVSANVYRRGGGRCPRSAP